MLPDLIEVLRAIVKDSVGFFDVHFNGVCRELVMAEDIEPGHRLGDVQEVGLTRITDFSSKLVEGQIVGPIFRYDLRVKQAIVRGCNGLVVLALFVVRRQHGRRGRVFNQDQI